MLSNAAKYASDIENIISEKKSYVEISADNISKDQKKGQILLADLTYLTKNVNGALDFYAGFNDKTFFDGSGWKPAADFDPTARSWYKGALAQNTAYVSDPYINAADGGTVVAISARLTDNGQTVGVLGADLSMKDFEDLVKGIKIKETGKAYLMNKNGSFIIHDKYTINDNIASVENGDLSEVASKLSTGQVEFLTGKSEGSKRFYAISPVKNTDWAIVLDAPVSEIVSASTQLALFMSIIGIISIIILLVIIFLMANSVSKPIIKLSECIQGMVEYDFTLTDTSPSVIYSKNRDEIGVISRALVTVKKTIQSIMVQITDIANQVSASSEELTASSEASAETSKNLSKTVEEISNGASMQADDMQKGAEAMQVMDGALNTNETIIETLNQTINEVSSAKEQGILTINQLISATKKLKDSAEHVHEVI